MEDMNWLPELEALARQAGELIKKGFAGSKTIQEKTSLVDIVTEYDTAVEELLTREITGRYPEHRILGEEAEFRNEGAFGSHLPEEGYVWVIDPIDGTQNFARGIPLIAVSIALFHEGKPLAGAVFNPIIGEMFLAQEGRGATLNGIALKVSPVRRLEQAMVAVSVARRKRDLELQSLADRVGMMRALGSAAVALAYVAAGRLNAYWEKDLSLWDIGAGILLVQEAGGEIAISNRESAYPVKIQELCAVSNMLEEYTRVLRGSGEERVLR